MQPVKFVSNIEIERPTSTILLRLESIHYNIVRKIKPHIGGQVLHPKHLRKSSEWVTHNKGFLKISLYKSLVVRDPLRGFPQMCRMQIQYVALFFQLSYKEWTLISLMLIQGVSLRIVWSNSRNIQIRICAYTRKTCHITLLQENIFLT